MRNHRAALALGAARLSLIVLLAALAAAYGAGIAHATCDDWSRSDTLMALALGGAVAVDVWTTHQGIDHGSKQEANPALGENPSRERLMGAAALAISTTLGVACILDRPWRERWIMFWIGVEVHVAYRNILKINQAQPRFLLGLRF